MINAGDLSNREIEPETLTTRQREVYTLVTAYYSVAREWPSSGWLSRRLNISRKSAYLHMIAIRDRSSRR